MRTTKSIEESGSRAKSRREFLLEALAFGALGLSCPSLCAEAHSVKSRRSLAYVGTYTGEGSNGEGIYLFQVDAKSGFLTKRRLVAKTESPSWIVVNPSRKYLYAANEIGSFNGTGGSISAFSIDPTSGDLTPINTVGSRGKGPAYISLDATGRFAFVADYASGSLAVFAIREDGSLGGSTDEKSDVGAVGRATAIDAPPESFATSGHDHPHVHMIAPDPMNRFVLAVDLGQDRIYSYQFDPTAGKLTPASVPFTSLPGGDGPRHFAFHPNGRWLYAIQEESSTVVVFHYDGRKGALTAAQTVSTLPPKFQGSSFASEVLVSPDGRFLYAANRLHDTIAIFAIGQEGRLRWVGEASALGDYPSQCRIEPSGRYFYACNHRSDSITSFRIDRASGLLTFTGQYAGVGSPGCITFLS